MRTAALVILLGACRVNFDLRDEALTTDAAIDAVPRTTRTLVFGFPGPNTTVMFDAWLAANVTSVRVEPDATVLDAALLSTIDIAIFHGVSGSLSTQELTALEAWIRAGGGLFTHTGYGGTVLAVNDLSSRFGIQFSGGTPLMSGTIAFAAHPAVSGVTRAPWLGGDTLALSMSAIPVATINASVIGAIATVGSGRVFAWGDDFVCYDAYMTQNWSNDGAQVLWVAIIDWLAQRT